MDATAGSGAGEGIGAGAGALAGLGASVFGDSSTGVATRGATKVVSKAAKQAPEAVTKVGKGLAAQSDAAVKVAKTANPDALLKSAKLAAQSDASRLASKAPVDAVAKAAKVAGSPTSTKLAKGLATNVDTATKAVKVAPEGFTKLGKGLAASGVAEGVASKAGLFAETTGKLAPKAGALGESTTALAAKITPVLDSTVAKATLGAAEGAGLAAGFAGVTVAGAEYMKQNLGVVLGLGALLGLAKWAGDALNEPKDGPLDKLTKK